MKISPGDLVYLKGDRKEHVHSISNVFGNLIEVYNEESRSESFVTHVNYVDDIMHLEEDIYIYEHVNELLEDVVDDIRESDVLMEDLKSNKKMHYQVTDKKGTVKIEITYEKR